MAVPAAAIVLPLGILALAYAVGGGKKRRQPAPVPDPIPDYPENGDDIVPEDQRPLSDAMIFDAGCWDLAVIVDPSPYDVRITEYYWQLRSSAYTDPIEIAVAILNADSPHCQWPPDPNEGASPMQLAIWDGTLGAVVNYMDLEMSGQLDQYSGFGMFESLG